MSALIHFIGIITFVTTSQVTPAPPHMLLPDFKQIMPPENRIITVPLSQVDLGLTTWPMINDGSNAVFSTGVKNITISGTDPFSVDPNNTVPHLTCCCAKMQEGLKDEYNDRHSNDKKAAFVSLDHGFLTTHTDASTGEIHFDLRVQVAPPANQLIITGSEKNQPDVRIVVNVAPNLEIGFWNKPANGEHKGHWHSYYSMGKNPDAEKCLAAPSDGGPCSPRTGGCLTQGAAAAAPKTAAANATPRPATAPSAIHGDNHLFTNVDCSNSQFP